jgi:hypothetical protein
MGRSGYCVNEKHLLTLSKIYHFLGRPACCSLVTIPAKLPWNILPQRMKICMQTLAQVPQFGN